ncbi:ribonuclease H-like domain-containing protein [Tanacetum coccineum]
MILQNESLPLHGSMEGICANGESYHPSCIKQLWATAKAKTVNGEVQIQALVDEKKMIITEMSVRRALQLKDVKGTEYLPNSTIFAELERMGYESIIQKLTFYKAFFSPQWKFLIHTILQCLSVKATAWNEFSSTMASAIICLATNQKFNFSMYIFDNMVKNLEGGVKFLMYPRLLCLPIKIKKFYKKTGRRPRVDGKMHVAFDKRKVECFNCHNTGHFARECKFKGSKEGSRQEAGRGQDFKPVRTEKEALMTIDEGQINWVEQTADEELNHALMAFTVNNELAVKKLESQLRASHKQQSSLTEKLNFQANQIFEKDEKLKKYRRIGMKAVKDKDALQKIVDSWFASSKNLWKLIDCGMSSTVKIELESTNGKGIRKKIAREAALKSRRMVHANVRQATPAWTNTNRANKANHFHLQTLSNVKAQPYTASKTIKNCVHVNSGTQIKSGSSRFNTGKQNVNSGSVHVNTARVNRSVSNQTSNKTKALKLSQLKPAGSKEVIDIDVHTEEAADPDGGFFYILTGATRKAAIYDKSSEGIFEKASYDDDGIITDFNNLPDELLKWVYKNKKWKVFCKNEEFGFDRFRDEEPEAQGRKSQDDPQDSSIKGLVTPPTTKANIKFAKTHNLVAFLEKPKESEGFEGLIDFLNASSIRYVLTVNPTILHELSSYGQLLRQRLSMGKTAKNRPQKKQPRREQRKDTKVPQPSGSIKPITDEAANEEHVPIHSNDPLFSVLDLENTKTSQAAEVAKLKKMVKKLERRNKSRTSGLKRLRKVGRTARIESSEDEGLGAQEDASKKPLKKKDQILVDEEIAQRLQEELQAELEEEESLARQKEEEDNLIS